MANGPATGTEEFIRRELTRLPPERGLLFKGKTAWIRCPNPEHSGGNERTPSCCIKFDNRGRIGRYVCYGCKDYGGWNKLAERLNLRKLDLSIDNSHEVSLGFSKHLQQEYRSIDYARLIKWPRERDWRGIRGDVVTDQLQGRILTKRKEPLLILPVFMHRRMRGWIEALPRKPRVSKEYGKEVSYINSPGEWSHNCLYGYDLARARDLRKEPLWVVEGPRDTANVLQHGGRVVGLLGSAVTPEKISLIIGMDPPAVLSATDPDEAGERAADDLLEGLGHLLPVFKVSFKEGTDAADMTGERVNTIVRQTKQRLSRRVPHD